MDLGFGKKNQLVGDVAAQAMLLASKAQEQVLEREMDKYDALLDDDEALEALRRKRLAEMKRAQQDLQQWKAQGHGTYTELSSGQDSRDVARDFFEASKQSKLLVVHFYRPSTRMCDAFHKHLETLAPKHLETRFLKINVEGCDASAGGGGATYLVEKLGIVVMPTLLVVKDRKVVHHIRGFDEMGSTPDFSAETLACVLGHYGGLKATEEERENPPDFGSNKAGVNRIRLGGGTSREYNQVDEEDF